MNYPAICYYCIFCNRNCCSIEFKNVLPFHCTICKNTFVKYEDLYKSLNYFHLRIYVVGV